MNSIYPEPSDQYILSLLNSDLKDSLYESVYNLSCILGDREGLVTKKTRDLALTSLVISDLSSVISIPEEDLEGVSDAYSQYLSLDYFDTKVPYTTYSMYTRFKNMDSDIVIALNADVSSVVYTPMLKISGILEPKLWSALGLIYLETYDLYTQILSFSVDNRVWITPSEIQSLENNISWVCPQLSEEIYYDVLTCLRDLQRNLSYIRQIPALFSESIEEKIQKIRDDYYGL